MKENKIIRINQHIAHVHTNGPNGIEHTYIIDANMMELSNKYHWYSVKGFDGKYRAVAYKRGSGLKKQKNIYLHRLIAGVVGKQSVIFLDQNPFNCRSQNLKKLSNRGDMVSEIFTCVLPQIGTNISHIYQKQDGERKYMGGFTHKGIFRRSPAVESPAAAKQWVMDEKAKLCNCAA